MNISFCTLLSWMFLIPAKFKALEQAKVDLTQVLSDTKTQLSKLAEDNSKLQSENVRLITVEQDLIAQRSKWEIENSKEN